jgi:phosphatidylglycerophosphate synthase
MYPEHIPSLAYGLLPPLALLGALLSLLAVFAVAQRSGTSSFRSPDRGESFLLSRFLRGYWYWLMNPIEEWLVRTGVRPATLNYLGFAFSVASGAFYAVGRFQSAGVCLAASGCLDMIDGQVARKSGRTSLHGAFLDSTLDRWSEFAVYLGLMIHFADNQVMWIACALALGGSFMVSYCRARGEALGIALKDVGVMQRAERLVLLIVASLLTPPSLALQQLMGVRPGAYLLALTILVLAAGTNWTAVTRFRHVLDVLGAPPERAAGGELGSGEPAFGAIPVISKPD